MWCVNGRVHCDGKQVLEGIRTTCSCRAHQKLIRQTKWRLRHEPDSVVARRATAALSAGEQSGRLTEYRNVLRGITVFRHFVPSRVEGLSRRPDVAAGRRHPGWGRSHHAVDRGPWLLSLPPATAVTEVPPVPRQESDTALASLKPKRERPLVAVIGIHDATGTTECPVPTGILRRANMADVTMLATDAGPVRVRLYAKVVGSAGLLDGKRATTHWYNIGEMLKRSPTIGYVADRRMVAEKAWRRRPASRPQCP